MKKTAIKLLSLLTVAGLLLSLCACEDEDKKNGADKSNQNVVQNGQGSGGSESETDPTQPEIIYPTPSQELSGELGGMTYHLSLDGTLTISGEGYWSDCVKYDSLGTDAPWFADRDAVLKIVIEEGITSVPTHAFYGCTNLQSVELPESMKKIGNLSFTYCANLKSIEFPDAITSIGRRSFSGSKSLTSIKWPANLEFIGQEAFTSCGIERLELPETVDTIQSGAFQGSLSLKEVTIPSKVKTIGKGAFEFCDGLTTVNIGQGVETIGEKAFYSCDSLETITIPENVLEIEDGAFGKCPGLKRVEILGMKTNLYYEVFQKSENVTVAAPLNSYAAVYCELSDVDYTEL